MTDHENTPFHYWQCGLNYVYLLNGVKWNENSHGRFFAIEDVEGLHNLLAHEIVTSPTKLEGQELRFLRSLLGLSQAALAMHMGLKRDAIAKCEAEPEGPLSGPMDRNLRFIYISQKNDPETFAQMAALTDDIVEEEAQREIKLKHQDDGWHANGMKAA